MSKLSEFLQYQPNHWQLLNSHRQTMNQNNICFETLYPFSQLAPKSIYSPVWYMWLSAREFITVLENFSLPKLSCFKYASRIDGPKLANQLLVVTDMSPQLFWWYELQDDKTNKMACAPSEDSDQPGHSTSLIRVFAVRMRKPWVHSYPLSAQRRLWSD